MSFFILLISRSGLCQCFRVRYVVLCTLMTQNIHARCFYFCVTFPHAVLSLMSAKSQLTFVRIINLEKDFQRCFLLIYNSPRSLYMTADGLVSLEKSRAFKTNRILKDCQLAYVSELSDTDRCRFFAATAVLSHQNKSLFSIRVKKDLIIYF